MDQFHVKLQKLVADSNLSQREIAEKIELDESTFSLYLSGKRRPNVPNFLKICNYFGISADFFSPQLDNEQTIKLPERNVN